ncbi:MAG: hypothetical protein KDA45_13200, partial [Planctomycetales bacterium]|nr:hypothetical protein [Planctomycetales bacterium]
LVVVDAGQGQRYAVDVFDVLGGQTHDYFLHGDADQPTSLATTLPLAPLATLLPPGFDWEPTRNEGETSRISAPHYAYGFLRKLRSATVAGGDTLSLDFQDGQGTGPGLRVSLIPEADSQLIIGENPSIRGADEDDTQLENFHRPFMILRRNAAGGRSRFVSVLQPYASTPFLKSVERIPTEGEALVLRVVSGERTDYIVVDAQGAVSLPSDSAATNYTFAATSAAIKISKLAEGRLLAPPAVGVLSLDAAGAVRTHVAGAGSWSRGAELQTTGSLHTAQLRAVDGQTLVVDAAKDVPLPPAGAVLRLLTADGWVYPFTLAAAQAAGESLRLEVVESPGIAWDPAAGQWQQISYPPRKHRGELRIEWSVRQ